MLPPAVTTTRRRCRERPFSRVDLVAQDREQVRLTLDRAVAVVGQLSAEGLHGLHDLGRRPVRHDALAERDGPRVGPDPLAEDGDDRGLDVGDAAREVHAPISSPNGQRADQSASRGTVCGT